MTYEKDYRNQIKKLTTHLTNRSSFKKEVAPVDLVNKLEIISNLIPTHANHTSGRKELNKSITTIRQIILKY